MTASKQKTVLVTGCSSGFGYLIALTFISNGWNVYGTVRDVARENAQKLLKKGVKILKMDLSKPETIVAAISQINTDTLDVLVNNAGVGFLEPVEDFSEQDIHYQFEVNFFGVHRIIKEILPMMRKQGHGRIINISSLAAISTTALYGIYSATKSALEAMSESLNLEVSRWNISVSLVEPGSFATNFGMNAKLPDSAIKDSSYAKLIAYNAKVRSNLDQKRSSLDVFRNPQRVANLVYKIACANKPKFRYKIGIDAFFTSLAVKLVPYQLRLAILKWVYRW